MAMEGKIMENDLNCLYPYEFYKTRIVNYEINDGIITFNFSDDSKLLFEYSDGFEYVFKDMLIDEAEYAQYSLKRSTTDAVAFSGLFTANSFLSVTDVLLAQTSSNPALSYGTAGFCVVAAVATGYSSVNAFKKIKSTKEYYNNICKSIDTIDDITKKNNNDAQLKLEL